MGFPRQEHWSGLPFPSAGDLPNLGMEPVSPALPGGFFTTEPWVKPTYWIGIVNLNLTSTHKAMSIILPFLWITEIRLKTIQKKRCQKEKKRLWNKLHVTDDTNKKIHTMAIFSTTMRKVLRPMTDEPSIHRHLCSQYLFSLTVCSWF